MFVVFANSTIKSSQIDKIKRVQIFSRTLEYFFHRGKYYVCRESIPSYRIGNSIGRWSIPSCSIVHYVGRYDAYANCGSTLSAVGVFPQLY